MLLPQTPNYICNCTGSFLGRLQHWMQRNTFTKGASIRFIFRENEHITEAPQMLNKPEQISSLANKPATVISLCWPWASTLHWQGPCGIGVNHGAW